jgi:hypothetical protein
MAKDYGQTSYIQTELVLELDRHRTRIIDAIEDYRWVKKGVISTLKYPIKNEEDYNRALRTLHNLKPAVTREYTQAIIARSKETINTRLGLKPTKILSNSDIIWNL